MSAYRVCTKAASVTDVIGTACTDCGHTSLVHPGLHNPMIYECVICSMINVTMRLEEQGTTQHIVHMSMSDTPPAGLTDEQKAKLGLIRRDEGPVWRSGPKGVDDPSQ